MGDHDAAALPGGRDCLAIDAARFLGKPQNICGAHADLAARLGTRLALLEGEQLGQIVPIGEDQIVQAAQHGGALLRG